MIELSVVINKRFMGTIKYQPRAINIGGRYVIITPMHWLFVCPICGDVWGMIEGSSEYYPLRIACEKHSWGFGTVPGSVLSDVHGYQLNQLPEPLIQREARLHLKYWENHNGEQEANSEE